MSTLKVNRIEPRTGDTVEIVGFDGGDDKYFHAYKKSDQTIENNVVTKAVLENVSSDPYGAWSSSNNEYTIPFDGLYMVHSNLAAHDQGSTSGLKNADVEIYVNGSIQEHGRCGNNFNCDYIGFFTNTLTRVLALSSGDKISWYVRFSCQDPKTPSALFIGGNADFHSSFAWIYKVASS